MKVKTSEQKAQELREKELHKIQQYCALTDHIMQLKGSDVLNSEALETSQKVLESNTEFYSLWNHRRQILARLEREGQDMQPFYEQELKFTEGAIRINPKSYWVWNHRKWLSQRMGKSFKWAEELKLCTLLLSLDTRNFHCWGYRRFIEAHGGIPDQKEFEYTTHKIEKDFSNYSAWHQRSLLLHKLYPSADELEVALKTEFELVWAAAYTQPSDQSPWIYHKWLIRTAKKTCGARISEVLKRELVQTLELLQQEPRAKWPLITAVFLMIDINRSEFSTQIDENIRILCEVDPFHTNFYKDLQANSLAV